MSLDFVFNNVSPYILCSGILIFHFLFSNHTIILDLRPTAKKKIFPAWIKLGLTHWFDFFPLK